MSKLMKHVLRPADLTIGRSEAVQRYMSHIERWKGDWPRYRDEERSVLKDDRKLAHAAINDLLANIATLESERDVLNAKVIEAERERTSATQGWHDLSAKTLDDERIFMIRFQDVVDQRDSLRARLSAAEGVVEAARKRFAEDAHNWRSKPPVVRPWWYEPIDDALRAYDAAQKTEHVKASNVEVIKCDFCGGSIPEGGEGCPEICPSCIDKEKRAEKAASLEDLGVLEERIIKCIIEACESVRRQTHDPNCYEMPYRELAAALRKSGK